MGGVIPLSLREGEGGIGGDSNVGVAERRGDGKEREGGDIMETGGWSEEGKETKGKGRRGEEIAQCKLPPFELPHFPMFQVWPRCCKRGKQRP